MTGDLLPAIERTVATEAEQGPQRAKTGAWQVHQAGAHEQQRPRELVFIDASVDDLDLLLTDLAQQREAGRSIEVIVLQSNRDGIEQISEALSQRQDLQAVHLVTHGDPQGLQVGSTRLDQASLLGHAGLISQWSAALGDSADLLLYGCDLAGSADGLRLIDQLGQLTGADVAASDDLTGAVALGGDWELEYRSGQIDSALAFSSGAQQHWQQVLATATFQEGVSGYTGTQDTMLHPDSPSTNYGSNTTLTLADDANAQILIRFDNIFGNGPGQIPYGSTITSASLLVYVVTADANETVNLYRVLTNWTEASTWNSMGSGLSTNGSEASSSPVASIGNTGASGLQTLSGLASIVQSWLDGDSANNGFMLQGIDAVWGIATSENGTASYRPELSVTYTPPAPPVVGNLGGDALNYHEGSGAVIIDQGTAATLTDSDTTVFNAGTLTVSIPAGGNSSQDALAVRHQGTGAGQIGISGSNITYGGTTIGTFTGGSAGVNLVVTLNGSATTAAVQALIRNITYANTDVDNPTAGARTVRFSLYDGSGGTSVNQDVTVTVVAANDPPAATITPTAYSATEQVTLNLHGTGLSISDPDANSANLVATLSVISGTLSVTAGSSGVAVSGSGSSSVTLTGTLAQINSLLAGNGGATVTFVHSSDAPPTSTTLTLGVNDQGNTGSGGALTGSDTATINITRVNDAPTGSVSIAGTATQGQTLTASNTVGDPDGMGSVGYQWLRNGVVIAGATSSTYGLTQADVGTVITVRASYTDGDGTLEAVTSAGTASVANLNDAPTGSVTISGTATQGQTLTAANTLADVDGMGPVSYQWLRNGVVIGGATGGSYVLTQADVGAAISVRGSYTDGQGTAESVTSTATASVANLNDAATGSVTVSGTATQGQTLTAGNTLADVDGMGAVSYQWLRNGVAIGGATGNSYVLTQADVGAAISVRGSYTDGYGAAEAVTSTATASVANFNDVPTGSVTVSGTALENQLLTAGNTLADADGMGTVSYQWLRDGVAVSGATGSSYLLAQDDVGSVISVRAEYVDGFGASESVTSAATGTVGNANDAPTGSVSVSGTATQGQVLTAANTLADADGMGTVSYQWLRDGVAIGGATGTTHVLTQDDVGTVITVLASYTDGQGTAESVTSAATGTVANINDAPTGSVTISGTATQGETLTVGNTLADADGMGPLSYQWLRDGVAIAGATGGSYVLTQDDVGAIIRVQASYTDGQGTAESATSAATAPVVNANDAPTGSVTITGTATQGQTLTAGNSLADADGMGTVNYQWLRDGVAISGATSGTYLLTQADVGTAITVQAHYTDGYGAAESVSSAATAPVANANDAPTGTVTITGTAAQGQTLTAGNSLADVDGMGTVSYQWLRDGVAIGGATGSTYVLTQADVGTAITVQASYTDGQGTAESALSAATAPVANINDAPTGSVTIAGTATQGQTLTAGNSLADADGMGTVSYQWLRDGVAISGATSGTYLLTQADVGAAITVQARYIDGHGTAESVSSAATPSVANANDAPTGSVTITGAATQGQTLAAGNSLADVDGMGTVSYQWLRDGVAIGGATGSTYVLTQADVGTAITVQASYTDGQGTAESATSAATASVTNINDAPTGAVTITGTATQGQTLTAGNTLADADGMGTVSYQWLRDGVAIAGANGSTHVLTQSDVGSAITVQASYTDGQGSAESMVSASTGAVANVNDAPTGSVTVTGIATQGQTLTAGNSLSDADGMGAVSYQWLRDGVAIGGATGGTYVLTQADVGTTITVQAGYTDGQGTAESVISAATAPVANLNDAPTGVVVITGIATQGQTLSAANTLTDVDGMGTVSYQWLRDGVAIGGATGGTYVLTQADVGTAITVQARYTDGQGTAESVTSTATASVANVNDAPAGAVTISGTATQGQTLTAGNTLADADGMGPASYQWLRDGVAIGGATGSTYVLTQADVGSAITVQASYTDGQGTAESATSAATTLVANINDAPTGSVTISGTATQGQTLTAGNSLADADGMGTVSYQWLRDGVAITGAAGSTYVLVQADVGTVITVRASYVDGHGAPESVTSAATAPVGNVNDAPTGQVTITGPLIQGETLVAGHTLADADGLGTVIYQWRRDGVAITGATGTTHTLAQDDVGRAISVIASYTDGHGALESVVGHAAGTVANINDAPTGQVLVNGLASQGQTLSVSHSLDDADGMGLVSYQWLSDGVAIAGATGSSLSLSQADVGKVITVYASYVDGHGAQELRHSLASGPVANVNDAPAAGGPLGLQRGQESTRFSFTLDAGAFIDVDAGDTLTISAAGLPSWLSYDSQTRTFQGIPSSADVGSRVITITATDGSGASVSSSFTLNIAAQPASGTAAAPVADRPALPVVSAPAPASPSADDSAATGTPDRSEPAGIATRADDSAPASTGTATAVDNLLVVSPPAASTFAQPQAGHLSAYASGLTPVGKVVVPAPPAFAIGLIDVSSTVQVAFGATPILLDSGTSALVIQDSTAGRHDASPGQDLSELIDMGQTTIESGSILVTIGSVWWAARSGALAAGLLACTPMWRHIDPLPIMGGGPGDDEHSDEGGNAADRHMAMAEKMFGDEPKRYSFIE